jgi:pimeloyl-ACP methyl ester carboxylesterase
VTTRLICLHGFTMNGAGLRHMLSELEPEWEHDFEIVCPDAPHTAAEASVRGITELMGGFRPRPPNLEWWNASEDGRVYRGWAESLERIRSAAEGQPSLGLLGFSQGAAVAAAVAALASRGEFPSLRFAVLIAGFAPRSDELAALFEPVVDVPSLHVWGEADSFAKHAPKLVEKFAPASREQWVWPGRHTVPTHPEARRVMLDFLQRHAHG